ncbi:hypothetical protein COU61_02855, partial [Candidatus Pacearchaeota archaeon CG10_big_fil_rev_8_21_14_0_10_35_13]
SLAYNPNDRYKSAEDLRDDLVKAFDRHYHGRKKLWTYITLGSIALSLLGDTIIGKLAVDETTKINKELKSRVEQSEEGRDYERKARIVEKFMKKEVNETDLWEVQKLKVYSEMFNDPRTAVLAYLDAQTTAKAIKDCGGKTDYDTLSRYLLDNSRNNGKARALWGSGNDLTESVYDNWMNSGVHDEDINNRIREEWEWMKKQVEILDDLKDKKKPEEKGDNK